MVKIINLEGVQKNTKKFYEICSDISVLQRELDQMLIAIEKNSIDFERGKISKELFKYNDDRMKKESAKIIKKINTFADLGIVLVDKINKEVASQRTETKEKKERRKIKEIKKSKVKRRGMAKKKSKPTPAPATAPAPIPPPTPPPA